MAQPKRFIKIGILININGAYSIRMAYYRYSRIIHDKTDELVGTAWNDEIDIILKRKQGIHILMTFDSENPVCTDNRLCRFLYYLRQYCVRSLSFFSAFENNSIS